jgi:hypothetical protein
MSKTVAMFAAAALCAAGCRSVGPSRVVHDRFDYAEAISDSWKNQMLLNLVKLRYADAPMLLDVSSVIAQYSFEGQLSASGNFPDISGENAAGIGAAGRWAERPTITYTPLSGQRFTRSLLTPITPAEVMSLVQSGWSIDLIFRLCVKSINGVRAASRMRLLAQAEDPRYQPLLAALRRLQEAGALDVRVQRKEGGETALLVMAGPSDAAVDADRTLVRQTLGLAAGQSEYLLVNGALSQSPQEIAMLTRSMIDLLTDMSFDVRVPPEHAADGRAGAEVSGPGITNGSFKVQSGKDRPDDAFAAVHYSGYWFWIDNRDFPSKRGLSLLMLLLSLAETGNAVAPGLTVSTAP